MITCTSNFIIINMEQTFSDGNTQLEMVEFVDTMVVNATNDVIFLYLLSADALTGLGFVSNDARRDGELK